MTSLYQSCTWRIEDSETLVCYSPLCILQTTNTAEVASTDLEHCIDRAEMVQLPLDVLINILSHVPPGRDRRDIGGLTLQNCLGVSYLFREAASLSLSWKPHYQMRYRYSDAYRERARSQTVEGNWRLMYAQRREIDRAALKSLDGIVATGVGLQVALTNLVGQSLDVWDVLELESTCPIPAEFAQTSADLGADTGEDIPEHAICRRYWARNIRDTIARGYGVGIWGRFKLDSETPSFELMMSSMSTFFGISDKEISNILDDLGARCRQELVEKSIVINKTQVDYDLRTICVEICAFICREGFSASFHVKPDILDKFPHAYLTTHKDTIPISLVHVFIAIAARLGIQAFPINFPGTVLCHVAAHEPDNPPLIVNPSSRNPNYAVLDDRIPPDESPVHRMSRYHPQQLVQRLLIPCPAVVMLLRFCRNVSASFSYGSDVQKYASALLISVIMLLYESDFINFADLLRLVKLRPLDCIFLLDEVEPYLAEDRAGRLRETCAAVLVDQKAAVQEQKWRKGENPGFFVGMPFYTHASSSPDFIWKWRGQLQSIGYCSVTEGLRALHGTRAYQDEGEIFSATFTLKDIRYLYNNVVDFPLWFEGVDLPKDPSKGVEHREGRGRLLLSPHAKQQYPGDSDVGAHWVEHGVFGLGLGEPESISGSQS